VVELIEAGEFHVFHDALRFALALAFSSKNAGEFLKPIPLDVCAGLAVRLHPRGNDLAEPVRRGHLRPRL
jgi:hypothetical protein